LREKKCDVEKRRREEEKMYDANWIKRVTRSVKSFSRRKKWLVGRGKTATSLL
jgi:hypothetical protein